MTQCGFLLVAVALVLALAQGFFLTPSLPHTGAATSAAAGMGGRASFVQDVQPPHTQSKYGRLNALYMGRRAAKNAARKGKSDAIKTKIYASYGKKLVMAVKAGGPDPEVNRALAVMIREAKAQGVPTDNVQRAIQRGSSANEADYKEAVYEAYGYGGAGLIINCLTDNTNRAKTLINDAIKKTDVKLATSGSVAFNFDRKGQIDLAGVVDEDQVLEAALEADVDDVDTKVDEEEQVTRVLVDPTSVGNLRDVLLGKGMEIKATVLVNVPKMVVDCSDEDYEGNMNVVEALLAIDDVDSVEHNVNTEDDDEE